MATKWETTYTDLTKVNGGNEYEDGDAITTDSVNVPIKNSAYAIQVANEAKIIANNAVNQTQHIPVVEYVDDRGVNEYFLTKEGLYNIEISFGYNDIDVWETGCFIIMYSDYIGDTIFFPTLTINGRTVTPSISRGYVSAKTGSGYYKIVRITRI